MESLGQYLKRERELRHISIEDVSQHTKYHVSSLNALENDQHEFLPAPPYVKGMLRSIAGHMGLDVTEVLLKYEDFLKTRESQTPSQKIGLLRIAFYQRKNFLVVTATAIFLVLSVGVFILFRESKKLEPIGDVLTLSPSTETLAEGQTGGHKLWIQASQHVWIKAQIDSDLPTQFYVAAGKSIELKGKKVIRFFVSDVSRLKLVFDNKEMVSEGEGPKTLEFR